MEVHDWETLGEHNLNITQWGKRKTVILLALKHSIIQKTWSIICMLVIDWPITIQYQLNNSNRTGHRTIQHGALHI